MNIREAARALGGEPSGRNRVLCPGPGHSRRDRSLAVTFTADGFLTHSFAGDDFRECRDHVKARLGWSDERPAPSNDNHRRIDLTPLTDPAKVAKALQIWNGAMALAGTLAETYLAARGLTYAGDALRFHPRCPFRKEHHPALVALMTDAVSGEPTGVHRTALLPDGTGKAAPGKMMLGRAAGAVVRISADDELSQGLAITEGIETALATDFRPVWACLSASTMTAFPVLDGVESLTIYADHDKAGLDAANECGARWHAAGREVVIVAPARRGADMADLMEAA